MVKKKTSQVVMILKKTWLSISDNTNVRWLQVFHLYKGFHRRQTYLGFFIKGSARVVEPPREEYKGFKFAFNLKGDICRGIVTRSAYPIQRADGSVLKFRQCCSVLVKKKQNLKSKYMNGPVSGTIRRAKFKSVFKHVI